MGAPWNVSVVKEVLNMTSEGKEVLSSLETDVKVEVCDDILAWKWEFIVVDTTDNLTADEIVKRFKAGSMSAQEISKTGVSMPNYPGYSLKSISTIYIKESVSNLDAAGTLRHEWMHIKKSTGGPYVEEEKIIQAIVSKCEEEQEKADL